ncbi:hypothetical protein STEG23_018392, partial [Scotinomys teguina]
MAAPRGAAAAAATTTAAAEALQAPRGVAAAEVAARAPLRAAPAPRAAVAAAERGGGAHQPHGGHADGCVRDVHARYQPHARHGARAPKQSSATAAAAAPAGYRVVAQLVAHPPVARR